ncbi:guanine nucleotide-binding protein g(o) subunit alpha [Anaeramoeba ignava]|uniref:Guanine nucleotide-binding protein g(O) subunit alpha n=1 Tax=Anaeramoeba ignava TaxID=1746090 RepID=A0A9Q0RHW5_ANAIG|nr:guanine nucleotide-binding protein g(o) subunit alpha [Anaeramoeba ignava]
MGNSYRDSSIPPFDSDRLRQQEKNSIILLGTDILLEKGKEISLNKYQMEILWNSSVIQEVFEKLPYSQYESYPYFFKSLDRFLLVNYSPNFEDYLNFRVKTTGIMETQVEINKQTIRFIDVGGARNERKMVN